MTLTAFAAPQIFDGHRWHTDCALLVEGAIVQAILPRTDLPEVSRTVDWDEGMIVPGFVDIQTNGGGGILLNDDPTPEGLERICAAQFAYGTTALLLKAPPSAQLGHGEAMRFALDAQAVHLFDADGRAIAPVAP